MLADRRNRLGWRDVVAGRPVVFPRLGLELFLDYLLPPRQSVPTAHVRETLWQIGRTSSWWSARNLLRGIVVKAVAANGDVAFAAQQVTVAIVAAPRTFRRWLATKIRGSESAHAVGADLVFFAQRPLRERSG